MGATAVRREAGARATARAAGRPEGEEGRWISAPILDLAEALPLELGGIQLAGEPDRVPEALQAFQAAGHAALRDRQAGR